MTMQVVFLTGGASSQFYMAPMNLLGSKETAGYVNTGTWSTKAIKEVSNFGTVTEVASSKDRSFCYIPKDYSISESLRYLHITSNNTISGTEYHVIPETEVPLVADMSSNIFSREVDISKYDMIYAGAQKNLGPAGVTLVIVKKAALGKVGRKIPTMLNYQTHIDKGSSFNTPPVYPIYVSMLTLRWIKRNGGVAEMAKRNDANRSRMNVCFRLHDESKEATFLDFAESRNLVGLKGHRSVGGFRASIYNAMELEGVTKLVQAMADFEAANV